MQITLNDQLTSTHRGYAYDLSRELSSALSKHARKKEGNPPNGYPRFNPIDEVPLSLLANPGLVGLLSEAYKSHLKVAITPQDIWIVLISEIAKEVNTNPEQYRSMFTKSDKKEEISVPSGSLTHIPTNLLSKALSEKVLFDSQLLFPQFSTDTAITTEVIQAMFCDMASPFYNYSMFCCGIPAVKLLGNQEDWQNLQTSWNKLITIFDSQTMKDYGSKVNNILEQINTTFTDSNSNADFWLNIFTQKNVGSGGELTINGWITELFVEKHKTPMLTNFTSTHGIVNYTQLETKREFYRIYGGFDMNKDSEEFYQLTYNSYVFEVTKAPMK